MTAADRHLQTFARQQLGHVPIESSELYVRMDTTTATRCTEAVDRVVIWRMEHLPVDSTSLYINADTTAVDEYIERATITGVDVARPDDEVTP